MLVMGKESAIRITSLTDGPLLVEGQADLVELVDQKGKTYIPLHPTKFALCRCGASSKKPFCDGTHTKVAFQGPPQSG